MLSRNAQQRTPSTLLTFLLLLTILLTSIPQTHAQGPSSGPPNNNNDPPPNTNSPSEPTSVPLEPPVGKRLFGTWLDLKLDTPKKFNERVGRNASAFLFTIEIPVENYEKDRKDDEEKRRNATLKAIEDLELIDRTETDAYLHLTVLPRYGLDNTNLTMQDLQLITNICRGFNLRGRGVFLRFGPGMNVPWVKWGQQPLQYITQYTALAKLIRSTPEANQTALVWAPYDGYGYPWSDSCCNNPQRGSPDFNALDTNDDGNLTSADDPYRPYYPGDKYVDWVALSIYHRGEIISTPLSKLQYRRQNALPNTTAIPSALLGTFLPSQIDFYHFYSRLKNKPLMISETAAVHHFNKSTNQPSPPSNTTELATKRTWWTQYLNPTFQTQFPNIKMVSIYEQTEETTQQPGELLDYRVTNRTLDAFKSDLNTVADTITFANNTGYRKTFIPTDAFDTPSGSGEIGSGNGNGGNLTRAAILGMILTPMIIVGCWVGYAVIKMRRRKMEEERRLEAGIPPPQEEGQEEEKGDKEEMESVDDGDTIVNVLIGERGEGERSELGANGEASGQLPRDSISVLSMDRRWVGGGDGYEGSLSGESLGGERSEVGEIGVGGNSNRNRHGE